MLVLVNSAEAPVLILASPLQLALNLLDLYPIARCHGDFAADDDKQHFNQRIGRDVRQFSVHRAPHRRATKDPFDNSYVHSGCQTRTHPDGSKPLQISGRDNSRAGAHAAIAAPTQCGHEALDVLTENMSLHSAAIASGANMASCRACLILPTLLKHEDFHLAAELQSTRTDELVDKRDVNFRKRTREDCKTRLSPRTDSVPKGFSP